MIEVIRLIRISVDDVVGSIKICVSLAYVAILITITCIRCSQCLVQCARLLPLLPQFVGERVVVDRFHDNMKAIIKLIKLYTSGCLSTSKCNSNSMIGIIRPTRILFANIICPINQGLHRKVSVLNSISFPMVEVIQTMRILINVDTFSKATFSIVVDTNLELKAELEGGSVKQLNTHSNPRQGMLIDYVIVPWNMSYHSFKNVGDSC